MASSWRGCEIASDSFLILAAFPCADGVEMLDEMGVKGLFQKGDHLVADAVALD